MTRQLRFDPPGGWHHVMHRGSRKQAIFHDDIDRHAILLRVEEATERWGVELHAYALMGNHYHLLVHAPQGGLSAAIKHVNASYAQDFNRRHGFDGHLFRGRFRSCLIGDDAYRAEVVRYIDRNSMMAGVIDDPINDPWCSHRFYVGEPPPRWLRTDVMRWVLGGPVEYRTFVLGLGGERAGAVNEALQAGRAAVGSEAFLRSLQGSAPVRKETVVSRRRLVPVDLDFLEEFVRAAHHTSPLPVRPLDVVLVLAAERGVGPTQAAEHFGLASPSVVSGRIFRLQRRAHDEPAVAAALDQCRRQVQPAA